MSASPTVVVVGSCNMDLVTRVPHLPLRGETITGATFGTYLGGKGLNQTVAARRMGANVALIGRIGSDDFGTRVRDLLIDEGIAAAHLRSDPHAPTGTALITVENGSGENTIVVVPGANGALTNADVDRAIDLIRRARVVLLQLEIPLATTIYAARLAHAAGVKVVLTPAPAQPLPAELFAVVDVLLPNEVELRHLIDREGSPSDRARDLIERGCGAVVVTLGSRGALLVTRDDEQQIAPFAVQPVDTVGAGDAFAGALGARLAAGDDLVAALRWASAAGSRAVTQPGAIPSLPTYAAVERVIGERNS